MPDATDGHGETTQISDRDWLRAAIWLGGIALIGIAVLIVLSNTVLCGCLTRPA